MFTADDTSGATSAGYLVKQLSLNRYIVSNGTLTRAVKLAQSLADVSNISQFAPATLTIFLTLADESIEHVRYIAGNRCTTIEGTNIAWSTQPAVAGYQGCISLPPSTLTLLSSFGRRQSMAVGDRR